MQGNLEEILKKKIIKTEQRKNQTKPRRIMYLIESFSY